MDIAIAMTTGDRSPGPNYVGSALRALVAQGVAPERIQLFVTSPNIDWLDAEHIPPVTLRIPSRPLNRVQNGVRLFQETQVSEWLLHLEDDISFCADFVGSVERWLTRYQDPQWKVYSFCALRYDHKFPLPAKHLEAWPLWPESGGLMAAALHKETVDGFVGEAVKLLPDWRKNKQTPEGWGPVSRKDWEGCGFDVMLHTWTGPYLASNPSFAQHEGDQSLAHRFHEATDGSDIRRCDIFAGHHWSYR
jgi:hypothetical protein